MKVQQHPNFQSKVNTVKSAQAIYDTIGSGAFQMQYKECERNTTNLEKAILGQELNNIKIDVEKFYRLYGIYSDERHNFQLVARMIYNENQFYINFVGNTAVKNSIKLFISRDYLLFSNSQLKSIGAVTATNILSEKENEELPEKRKNITLDILKKFESDINFLNKKRRRGGEEEDEPSLKKIKALNLIESVNSDITMNVAGLFYYLDITKDDLSLFDRYATHEEKNEWDNNELENINIDFELIDLLYHIGTPDYYHSYLVYRQKYKNSYIYVYIHIKYPNEEEEEEEEENYIANHGEILISKNPEYLMNAINFSDCSRQELYTYFESYDDIEFKNPPKYFCSACNNTFSHRKYQINMVR